ncbi:hypothetical protein D3C72_2475900 [compost metagenome]
MNQVIWASCSNLGKHGCITAVYKLKHIVCTVNCEDHFLLVAYRTANDWKNLSQKFLARFSAKCFIFGTAI